MFIVEKFGEMYYSTREWRPIYGSVNPVDALKRYIREYEALRRGGVRLKEVRPDRSADILIQEAWASRR